MMTKEDEVLTAALSLPPDSRAAVADRLLDSLDGPDQQEIDRLWAREAEDRLQAFDAGEIEAIPGEEVFKSLRARLKK